MRQRRRVGATLAVTAAAAGLAWLLFAGLPRWYSAPAGGGAPVSPSGEASSVRKIKARLFYVSDDGTKLTSVEHDVPYAEGTVAQAKAILTAQIAPVAEPLLSAVPLGTTLRALFVTARGEAYVDLSRELTAAHPGGSLNELLTIYTLVDALTVNLPAISSVQLLVDGREVDTIAGHVDLRRPLLKNLDWIQ
jgi:spore germination protein GerM